MPLTEGSSAGATRPLPPGQSVAPLRRFGLPWFAGRVPAPPVAPVITVGGAVRRPTQVPVAELMALGPRRDLVADLHCVTTWTATDLRWGGTPFALVHLHLADLVHPHPRARWIAVTGLDGYRACLRLDDALADDVLLADTFDGAPLTGPVGAPVRLVAPRQYGYKSVRHVCAIDYLLDYEGGSAGWLGHPRARVGREERSRFLPGRVWRPIWRRAQSRVRRAYHAVDG
ncbi:molybdopterin-dependent oxidoreductase [Micromonospora coxensis]|uniref:molybdopterin-dependent oxidoreductase n=1 Tax=Micromonospora coxensis TaxID=356852 RepID=UPI0034359D30